MPSTAAEQAFLVDEIAQISKGNIGEFYDFFERSKAQLHSSSSWKDDVFPKAFEYRRRSNRLAEDCLLHNICVIYGCFSEGREWRKYLERLKDQHQATEADLVESIRNLTRAFEEKVHEQQQDSRHFRAWPLRFDGEIHPDCLGAWAKKNLEKEADFEQTTDDEGRKVLTVTSWTCPTDEMLKSLITASKIRSDFEAPKADSTSYSNSSSLESRNTSSGGGVRLGSAFPPEPASRPGAITSPTSHLSRDDPSSSQNSSQTRRTSDQGLVNPEARLEPHQTYEADLPLRPSRVKDTATSNRATIPAEVDEELQFFSRLDRADMPSPGMGAYPPPDRSTWLPHLETYLNTSYRDSR